MEEIEEKIEEVLRNRILFIGNEIPEVFTKEKRDKQLYTGYPKQLTDELTKVFLSLQADWKKKVEGKRIKLRHSYKQRDEDIRKTERYLVAKGYNQALDDLLKEV